MSSGSPSRRILLVLNDFGWAGADKQLYHLARGLSEAGHLVTALAIGPALIEAQSLVGAYVELISLGAVGPMAKLKAMPAMIRQARKAEIVHCTGYDATLWGRVAAILARRPAVFTEHTPGRALQRSRHGAPRERLIALHNRVLDRWTYMAIVVGHWQEQLLVGEGVKPSAIVHIPNGVPVDALRREAEAGPTREELGIPPTSPLLLHVAAFLPQKGQEETLRAAHRLRETHGDVRVLFAGDGACEAPVKEEADRIGAAWATFLGQRDDVPGLMRLADLCVLPSKGEGLPMALIEASALETPVVATDVGDIGWLLGETGGGICVPAADGEAFFEACDRVLGDTALRERLAAAGLEGVRARFDAPTMTRRYEEVFEAALRSAPRPLTLSV
jgi:glycosyltransferase involved in cell wall biosynthesis